jgi:hypothetical protein
MGTDDWWQSGRVTPVAGSPPPPLTSPARAQVPLGFSRMVAAKPRASSRPRRSGINFKPLLLLPCAALIMFGSLAPWVTVDFLHRAFDVDGTEHSVTAAYGINGWTSFAAGGVLGFAGLLLIVWARSLLKFLAFLAAFIGLGVGAYELVRILHDMSQVHSQPEKVSPVLAQAFNSTSVGYGLILVGVGGFAGLLLTLTDMESRG